MVFPNNAIFICIFLFSVCSQAVVTWNTTHIYPDQNQSEISALEENGDITTGILNNTATVQYSQMILNVVSVSNVSIHLTWDKPESPSGPIKVYQVWWESDNSLEKSSWTTTDRFYHIEGLKPYTNYTVKVRFFTADSEPEPWSEDVWIRTDVGVPSAPTELDIYSITDTRLSFTWDWPVPNVGPIEHFEVQVKNSSGITIMSDIVYGETSYTMINLTTNTIYSTAVRARTSAGEGAWSKVFGKTAGDYETTGNTMYQTGSTISITDQDPYAPMNLSFTSITNTSMFLTWQDPELPIGTIKSYRVLWESRISYLWGITPKRFYHIERLKPYTNYTVKVQAITSGGLFGYWSDAVSICTEVGVPSAPTGLNIYSITITSLSITWNSPFPDVGPIELYEVQVKNYKRTNTMTGYVYNETSYTMQNLTPDTFYIVTVRASTQAGVGPWSKEFTRKTSGGDPYSPMNFRVASITNTSMFLTWQDPEESPNRTVESYRVQWETDSSYESARTTNRFYRIEGLEPYTNYTVRVQAITSAGPGQWSDDVSIRTDVGVPSAPTDPHIYSITNTNLAITWNSPFPDVGPIKYFEVHAKQYYKRTNTVTAYVYGGTSYTMKNLTLGTLYIVTVRASTIAGAGPWSEELIRKTTGGVDRCIKDFCHNGGICKEDDIGNPMCYCKIPYTGERCEDGDGLMIISRQIIMISVTSVSLVVIAVIAACMLWLCIRNRKAS